MPGGHTEPADAMATEAGMTSRADLGGDLNSSYSIVIMFKSARSGLLAWLVE